MGQLAALEAEHLSRASPSVKTFVWCTKGRHQEIVTAKSDELSEG